MKINNCVTIPATMTGEEKNLISLLAKIIKEKLYPNKDEDDRYYTPELNIDICSTSLFKDDNDNLIFQYKAVPAYASTMSSYPYCHTLVIQLDKVVSI